MTRPHCFRTHPLYRRLLVAGWMITLPLTAMAQDPFSSPFGTRTEPTTTEPADEDAATAPALDADPDVRMIQELNLTTPSDWMMAVRALVLLRRPDAAKPYLQQLVDADLDDATKVALFREYGTSTMLMLGSVEQLQPEGRELALAIQKAAYAAATDRARLDQLITRLHEPDSYQRRAAVRDLRKAGSPAVDALIATLATAEPDERTRLREALVVMGEQDTLPRVLGSLETSDLDLRAELMRVLGQLQSTTAVGVLLGPALGEDQAANVQAAARDALQQLLGGVPTRSEAEQFLYRRAIAMLGDERQPSIGNHEGLAMVFRWDPMQQVPVGQMVPAEDADFLEVSRTAESLYRLVSDNPDYQELFMATRLEAEKRLAGLDQPLPRGPESAYELATLAGPQVLEDVLAYALQRDLSGAAVAAAEVLGDIGSAAMLESASGRSSPLVAALHQPDRRLQFTAAQAIAKLDPQRRYAGSSYLSEVMGFLSGSAGTARVLIGMPKIGDGQDLVGSLSELGFAAETAQSGAALLNMAHDHPDYQFVLISSTLDRPDTWQTIQQLRNSPLAAALPIGIMAQPDVLARGKQLAESMDHVYAFPRPRTTADLEYEIGRLLRDLGRDHVLVTERLDQAQFALDTMARWAENETTYGFYDLVRQQPHIYRALYTPALSVPATRLLGLLGTTEAQTWLLEFASQEGLPMAARTAAAEALGTAIRRRGLLLTRPNILSSYDRYNASESASRETQQVLGAVLDAIETPLHTDLADQE